MPENAKIDSTKLGIEDHGIMTAFLHLSFGGGVAQSFGGYNLTNSEQLKRWIKNITEVVGVEDWEELPGKYIRIENDGAGKIQKIGNLLEDKWFDPTVTSRK
jgi:hypothetical protein